jgi:hypothetical protein
MLTYADVCKEVNFTVVAQDPNLEQVWVWVWVWVCVCVCVYVCVCVCVYSYIADRVYGNGAALVCTYADVC